MKKIKHENHNEGNILNELHIFFMELPIRFREATCVECNWSLPTFYRKMRTQDKGASALSNAEKEGILRKAKKCSEELNNFVNKYQK